MSRPKLHDEEALFLMRRFIEDDRFAIRAAARRVARGRGYPEFKVKTFEEWARKEYASRQRAGTLPDKLPLANDLADGIRRHFQEQEEAKTRARRELSQAINEAAQLGIDLSNPINRRALLTAEKNDLTVVLESTPHMALVFLAEGGEISASSTEDEVTACLQEKSERLRRITRAIAILDKYIGASRFLEL